MEAVTATLWALVQMIALIAALTALFIQLTGLIRPLAPAYGRLKIFRPPNGRETAGRHGSSPIIGRTTTFTPNVPASTASHERRVYLPNSLAGFFIRPESPNEVEGNFVIQNRRILAAKIGPDLIMDRKVVVRLNVLANSVSIFGLTILGTVLFLLNFIHMDGSLDSIRPSLLSPANFKQLMTELAFCLLIALSFWLSLGWLKANLTVRRLESILPALGGSPTRLSQPSGRRLGVPLAWLILFSALLGGLAIVAGLWP